MIWWDDVVKTAFALSALLLVSWLWYKAGYSAGCKKSYWTGYYKGYNDGREAGRREPS